MSRKQSINIEQQTIFPMFGRIYTIYFEVTQQAHWIIISYPGYCVLQHT